MVLILNCGSQSIKWKLFDLKLKLVKENKLEVSDAKDYEKLLGEEIEKLSAQGGPASGGKIEIIGHRVVHGGEEFTKPTKITEQVLEELEKISHLAPLHNPYNILGIKICRRTFSEIPQFAVFDTEFFSDLPEKAFTYALPENIVKEFGFRRYGFHGISHEYVAKKAVEKLSAQGGPASGGKIITCHLGGGSSITAIKNGKAIDTSMGFTPMDGLVMMTRSGNVDPGIILELVKKFGVEKTDEILNSESGIKGICGEGEMLEVLSRLKRDPAVAGQKNKYKLAFDVFVYSIKKYIGSYFSILGGCDLLVFTGSIGSGEEITRNSVVKNLDILKKTKILAIETDEELAIAQKIKNL